MSGGPGALRVLLTNLRLDSRTGTEIVTRNLAEALMAAGHRPVVYPPRLGAVAEEYPRPVGAGGR